MTIRISKKNFEVINEDVGGAAMGGTPGAGGLTPLVPGGDGWPGARPGDARNAFPMTGFVAKKKRKLVEADVLEDIAEILAVFKNEEKMKNFLKENPEWEDIQITMPGGARIADIKQYGA